jgi:hypothetical protein
MHPPNSSDTASHRITDWFRIYSALLLHRAGFMTEKAAGILPLDDILAISLPHARVMSSTELDTDHAASEGYARARSWAGSTFAILANP